RGAPPLGRGGLAGQPGGAKRVGRRAQDDPDPGGGLRRAPRRATPWRRATGAPVLHSLSGHRRPDASGRRVVFARFLALLRVTRARLVGSLPVAVARPRPGGGGRRRREPEPELRRLGIYCRPAS